MQFATKPALATTMITHALDAGVDAPWVTGDEVYGADPRLRAELEGRGVGYVLAIGCDRRTKEPAFYRCYAPTPVALGFLVRVAGTRWCVEESFQTGKGLAGPDQHQVRRWVSWHRWTVLAMLAQAFLSVVAATERIREPASTGWISVTCNEVQHMLATLVITPTTNIAHRLRFSAWRRRPQHRARLAHYQRPSTREP